MAEGLTIVGSGASDEIFGFIDDDTISGMGGDDQIDGGGGNDLLAGDSGFDNLRGGRGNDTMTGGTQADFLFGDGGRDSLFGDSGVATLKGSDLASDYLNGGSGADVLHQSDGNDTLAGGGGRDSFQFKWNDPMVGLAAGTGRAFAAITDFIAEDDRLLFDVAGVGSDAAGANFIGNGGKASSFFSGNAADSDGEAVMVLTDQAFASGVDAVLAAQNEVVGDFVLYFNSTVNVASLLYVDATDTAHSIARFTNITSLSDLQNVGFATSDFIFV